MLPAWCSASWQAKHVTCNELKDNIINYVITID